MDYNFSATHVYAFPIIDGMECKANTNFVMDGKQSEFTFFVVDSESEEFLKNALSPKDHQFGFRVGANHSGRNLPYGLYSKCEVKVKEIKSAMDEFTEVTLLVTEK